MSPSREDKGKIPGITSGYFLTHTHACVIQNLSLGAEPQEKHE
jgi:hypothetical protein